jgi:hypothetical protein
MQLADTKDVLISGNQWDPQVLNVWFPVLTPNLTLE